MKKFTSMGRVEFLKADQGRFKILAYSGSVVERGWGKLIIDLDGITAKQAIPIFLNHDPSKIVGYSEKVWSETGGFYVQGKFSGSTDAAKEARALSGEGFPWQASIGVAPVETEEVGAGSTRTVNGNTVSGPAEIWTKSEIFETSFVPLGADSNTSISTFDQNKGVIDMTALKQQWERNAELQKEFGDFETYAAFKQAEHAGLVKQIGKETPGTQLTITGADPETQWLGSPQLRAEFFGDFECFKAFCKNQHRVKIAGGRRNA